MASLTRKIILLSSIIGATGYGWILPAHAQETLELEGTAIIGNRELPKILYIVPWKSPQKFNLTTPAVNSIMEQALAPVNRREFKRRIKYHNSLFTDASSARKTP